MGEYGTNDLVMTAGDGYTKTFATDDVVEDWADWTPALEVRNRAGGLEADFTPYLDVVDNELVLELPGVVTSLLPAEARWDLFAYKTADIDQAVRTPIPSGRVLVFFGVTAVPTP